MANVKISSLTAASTPVAGTEVLPIVQSGATVKVSIANLTPGLDTITAAKGGTGQTSYAVGDLLYASTTTALSKLADVATGNALISGGVNTAPSWGKIGLTTHVSGTLPTTNGGTGLSSFTANGVVYASSTSALTTGSALVFNGTNLGIGTSTPSSILHLYDTAPLLSATSSNNSSGLRFNVEGTAATTYRFQYGGTTQLTLDSAGNLGLGVTPSTTTAKHIQGPASFFMGPQGDGFYLMSNAYYNSGFKYATTDVASYYSQSAGLHRWYNAASGTAGNAITFTQAMTLDASGNLLVGVTSSSVNMITKSTAQGNGVLFVDNGTNVSFRAYSVSADGYNAAATAMNFGKNSSTSRSINAGGTINASGADYAEYMTKAGDFVVAKGDVVGINAEGKLTNVFADAVSFVVKSTDPSYVGGDVWGNEEALGLTFPEQPSAEATDEEKAQYETDKAAFETALEAARQKVDRIAFAGQVPVNVMGATAGQYIIPVSDNGAIKGEAVSNPTFEQYQQAVGKVIAIESDGRAKIIVKVA